MESTCLFVFCTKFCITKIVNKMRFLWNRNNTKIDHISSLQYTQFEPCPGDICGCS